MTEPQTSPSIDARDVVELRLPADAAYLGVVRTATAGLAARLDFTIDEIEDLRIAVDEACAILLPDVVSGEFVECLFALDGEVLDVTISARIEGDHRPAAGQLRLDRPRSADRIGGVGDPGRPGLPASAQASRPGVG